MSIEYLPDIILLIIMTVCATLACVIAKDEFKAGNLKNFLLALITGVIILFIALIITFDIPFFTIIMGWAERFGRWILNDSSFTGVDL